METNNKGFSVERSTDGSNFQSIAWVAGRGTIHTESRYQMVDNFVQPDISYYYRLKQEDFDGKQTLSPVRQARLGLDIVTLHLSPNPARNKVQVFLSGTNGPAHFNITDAYGKIVKSWRHVQMSTSFTIDISGLPAGYYIVRAYHNQEMLSTPLVVH
jgi:hypothetical protein